MIEESNYCLIEDRAKKLWREEGFAIMDNNLPESKESHGSYVVRESTLLFAPNKGGYIEIATYETQQEAISHCIHNNNFLVGVGCGATVVE